MNLWHKIEAWGSEHPVALGFIVFGIGALLLYMFIPAKTTAAATSAGDGGAGAYYAAQTSATAQGNSLALAQAQLQAANVKSQNDLAATQAQAAGYVDIARLQSQADISLATIAAGTDQMQIAANLESNKLASSLGAATAQAGYDRDVSLQQILSAADITKAQYATQASLGQAAFNAATAESSYQAQYAAIVNNNSAAVQQAQIAAAADVANATAGQGVYGAVIGSSAYNYLTATQPYAGDTGLLGQALAQGSSLNTVPLPSVRQAPLLDISTASRYF